MNYMTNYLWNINRAIKQLFQSFVTANRIDRDGDNSILYDR